MGCKSIPFATSGKTKCRFMAIEGVLTIDTVASFQEEMLKAVKKEIAYIVDMTNVTECDLAGIQLIYSLFLLFAERATEFQIKGLSESLEELLDATGIILPESTLEVEI